MRHRFVRFAASLATALTLLLVGAALASAIPTLTVAPPDGAEGWYQTSPQIGFTSDAGFTTRYQWNAAEPASWIPYAAPFFAPHGVQMLQYQFLDALGDPYLGTTYSRQFLVDSDLPTMTALAETRGEPAEWHRSASATFTWDAEDGASGVADYLVAFDGSECTTSARIITESGLYTGEWVIAVKARDRAGNWGQPRSLTHLVDLTGPSALASALDRYEGGPATVTVIAYDSNSGVDSIETKIDDGAWVEGATRGVTGVAHHTLYYRATDYAGNVSGERSVSFDIVPNEPPATTTEFDDDRWYAGDVSISFDATDNLSGVLATYYEIDGEEHEYTGEAVVTGQGIKQLRYWSVDNKGNVEPPNRLTVRIDRSAPEITVDMADSYEGTAVCTFSATDTPSGLASPPIARSDGTVWDESPAHISGLGLHDVTFNATDVAGHTSEKSRQVSVAANEAPSTSIFGLTGDWQGPRATFRLTATDNLSGVASMFYRLGSGQPAEYFANVDVTREGTTPITFWSTDRVGNVEPESEAVYAYVDGSAPVTISDVLPSYTATATIALSSSDAYSGVDRIWYQLDSGEVLPYENPFEVTKRGLSTLRFGAFDNVENAEPTHTATFVIGRFDTTLTARASSAKVRSGSLAAITGKLTYSGGVVGGAPVTVWASVAGGAWTKVGSAAFDSATGTYRASRRIYANQRLQLRFAGDGIHVKSASPIVSVGCLAKLSMPSAPWVNYRGRRIIVFGNMQPRHTTGSRVAKLYSYHWESDRWVLRQVNDAFAYRASTGTKYGAVIRLYRSGRWKIVAVHNDAAHTKSSSAPRILLVR